MHPGNAVPVAGRRAASHPPPGAGQTIMGCALLLLRNSHCKSLVGLESYFFPSGPKRVLVGRLPCSRGDKSVAHPTDRRHSCRRWWAWKAVSSRRGQNLFWWGGSHVAGAARVSPIRRTGDTPVADGGLGKVFLPVGAKTCFGGEAPMQQGRQECRPSDGPATLLSPMVATKARFAPHHPPSRAAKKHHS